MTPTHLSATINNLLIFFKKNCPIIDIPKYPSPKFDFNFDYNDLKKQMSRAFSKYKRTKKDSDWDTYKRLEKDKKRLAQKLTKEKKQQRFR